MSPTLRRVSASPGHQATGRMQRRQQLRQQLCQAPTTGLDVALDALSPEPASSHDARVSHAIVVLGVPVAADGSLSEGLRLRIHRAAQAARQDPAALVLVTGGAVANNHGEAETMARTLTTMGIDPRRIYIEPHARTTLDNAAFCCHLLERLWPRAPERPLHLTIVAEPYHAVRALRLFAAAQITYGLEGTLHLAASPHGPTPARMAHDSTVYVGNMPLPGDFQARLSRCIEEKRRIACGW
jgi:hypothetical protein